MTAQIDLPCDCALAFGIPLSRDDFIADLRGENGKEYARRFELQLAALSMDELWARYEAVVAAPALSAIDIVGCKGVRIERRITPEQLRETLREKRVVTLFAHWRQGGFTRDSIQDPNWYVSEIRAARGPLGQALAQSLPHLASLDSGGLAEFLNRSLRSFIVIEDQEQQPGATWVASDPQQNLDRNFEVLRNEFPNWQLAPVGMELANGTYSVSEMVSIVSREYSGTLDLRMCNSVLPGEAIKRVAPRAQVLMNRELVAPQVQLALYKQTIHLLESGDYDYGGAATALGKAVLRRLI